MVTERDKSKIVKLYLVKKMTMHDIAVAYHVSGATLRRWLLHWGVKPRNKSEASANRPAFSDETKKKMSAARLRLFAKGFVVPNKGKKASVELRTKNMVGRMRSKLDLASYDDFQKLKFLTYYLSKHRKLIGSDDISKLAFLEKFYYDSQFNAIYSAWISSGKTKWARPSLDHKVPVSRGGLTQLKNLQFLTWFENRAKAEMNEREWSEFCRMSKTSSNLFIRCK